MLKFLNQQTPVPSKQQILLVQKKIINFIIDTEIADQQALFQVFQALIEIPPTLVYIETTKILRTLKCFRKQFAANPNKIFQGLSELANKIYLFWKDCKYTQELRSCISQQILPILKKPRVRQIKKLPNKRPKAPPQVIQREDPIEVSSSSCAKPEVRKKACRKIAEVLEKNMFQRTEAQKLALEIESKLRKKDPRMATTYQRLFKNMLRDIQKLTPKDYYNWIDGQDQQMGCQLQMGVCCSEEISLSKQFNKNKTTIQSIYDLLRKSIGVCAQKDRKQLILYLLLVENELERFFRKVLKNRETAVNKGEISRRENIEEELFDMQDQLEGLKQLQQLFVKISFGPRNSFKGRIVCFDTEEVVKELEGEFKLYLEGKISFNGILLKYPVNSEDVEQSEVIEKLIQLSRKILKTEKRNIELQSRLKKSTTEKFPLKKMESLTVEVLENFDRGKEVPEKKINVKSYAIQQDQAGIMRTLTKKRKEKRNQTSRINK